MKTSSASRRIVAAAILSLIVGTAKAQTGSKGVVRPADQTRFYGKWKFNAAASKLVHKNDANGLPQWRSYEPDGERVKVSWGNGDRQDGTYSARCDGTFEPAAGGQIRCWQVSLDRIDGEQLDKTDAAHRYYRRTVSPDGKTLTLTWYADAKRNRPTDTLVYVKQP